MGEAVSPDGTRREEGSPDKVVVATLLGRQEEVAGPHPPAGGRFPPPRPRRRNIRSHGRAPRRRGATRGSPRPSGRRAATHAHGCGRRRSPSPTPTACPVAVG